MAVKIKARGAGTKSSKTEDEAKPARRTRSTSTTKRGSSRAAKTDEAPKRRGRPRKNQSETAKAAAPDTAAPRRRNSTGVDPRLEARLLKAVEKAGDRRRKAEAEHKESVNALHAAAQDALSQGVSMAKVSDFSGISRQWLYKMGDFADRANGGNGGDKEAPAPKRAAKSTAPAKRSSGAKATTRPTTRGKRSNEKAQTKASGGSRRRVAIRSAS